MSQELQDYLKLALSRLEKISQEVMAQQGYTADTEKLQLLLELAREQVQDENPST
jgi:hypothetical protein